MAEVKYTFSLQDLVSGKLFKLTDSAGKAISKVDKLDNSISGLGKTLAASFSIGASIAFSKQILETTARFQSMSNAIKFASDNAAEGEMSLLWIKDMSQKYGLPLAEMTQGFKTFQGAMMETKFESEEVRKMFGQVTKGVVTMGLTADDARGVFLALGQIMGKGKVQAEELRGQIGERIPGAFKIAAKAMNMTTAELDKFMSDGKLMAEDFLPKFAAEMERTFGEGAEKNIDTVTASMNRLGNSWDQLLVNIGNSQGVLKSAVDILGSFANTLSNTITGESGRINNEATPVATKRVEDLENYFTEKAKKLKASGISKQKIYDILSKESDNEIILASEDKRRRQKNLRYDELALKNAESKGGRLGIKQAERNLFQDKMNIRIDELLGESLKVMVDKVTAKVFAKPNGGLDSKTAKTKTSKDSERVRGVKHIIINIGKLVETQNIQVADLNTLGFKIKELVSKELLTAVNDVNIVAGR